MTTVVTVSNGIGTQYGRLSAYDRAAAVSITGLASEFYSVAVTGTLTTADGATALAPIATGTVSAAGAVTLTFDLDTTAMATLMTGRTDDADTVLTVYATGTESNACIATLKLSQAADHGTTTTATDATPASLAEVQALVDAAFAAAVSWPTEDGSELADANRFAVGQLAGETWTWVAKTGTQIKTWLKTYLDTLYAGLAHASSHATGQSDALAAADIGAYRTQTPAAASNISGSVALAFASSLTLQHTLTGNVTALTEPTGLADGETGEAIVEMAGFTLPDSPAAGQRWDENSWTVTGTYVRIVVERVGSYYFWTAESLEVAT